MRGPLKTVVTTLLALTVAVSPLRAQLAQGEFATPEEELAALLMVTLEDTGRADELDAMVNALAPLTIIPTKPRAEGEWAHYNGGQTGRSSLDFVWGYVTWRLSGSGIGATIVASFYIADRDMVGTMAIARVDPAIADAIRVELQFSDTGSGPNIYPQGQFSSRLAINFTPIDGVIDPVGRIVVNLPAVEPIFTSEAVGFHTLPPLGGGTHASIMLSLGETGRAVFDEAMAAWGIAPTE